MKHALARASERGRRWGRRALAATWLRVVGGAIVVAYATYVVGALLLLNLGGLEAASKRLDDARFKATSGYSLWPGKVTIRGAEFVFQDPNLTMQILAAEADIDFGVLSILSREMHIESFRANGAKFRLRHRVKSDLRGNQARIDAFPVIEGFERSALRGERGPRAKHPLTVRVDEIKANVDEVWILEYRTTGDFRAEGGFALTDEVKVFPSKVDLSFGRTRVGEREVLLAKDCSIHADVGPFPRRKPSIDEVVGSIATRVRCQMRAIDLSIAQLYPKEAPFQLEGRVFADVDAQVKGGKFTNGKLRFTDAKTRVIWRGVSFPTTWGATIDVPEPGLVRARVDASVNRGDFSSRVQAARIEIQAKHTTFPEQTLMRADANLKNVAFEDGRFLSALLGKQGAPSLRLHPSDVSLAYTAKPRTFSTRAKLFATLDTKDASIGVGGDLDVDCTAKDDKTVCGKFVLDAPLTYRAGGKAETIPLSVRASEMTMSLPDAADARFSIRAGNPKAFLKHALGLGFFGKAGLSVLPLGTLDGVVNLNKVQGTIAGNVPTLSCGNVSIEGRFVAANSVVSAWSIRTPLGRYGITQQVQGVKVHPLVKRDWFDSCEARLDDSC